MVGVSAPHKERGFNASFHDIIGAESLAVPFNHAYPPQGENWWPDI